MAATERSQRTITRIKRERGPDGVITTTRIIENFGGGHDEAAVRRMHARLLSRRSSKSTARSATPLPAVEGAQGNLSTVRTVFTRKSTTARLREAVADEVGEAAPVEGDADAAAATRDSRRSAPPSVASSGERWASARQIGEDDDVDHGERSEGGVEVKEAPAGAVPRRTLRTPTPASSARPASAPMSRRAHKGRPAGKPVSRQRRRNGVPDGKGYHTYDADKAARAALARQRQRGASGSEECRHCCDVGRAGGFDKPSYHTGPHVPTPAPEKFFARPASAGAKAFLPGGTKAAWRARGGHGAGGGFGDAVSAVDALARKAITGAQFKVGSAPKLFDSGVALLGPSESPRKGEGQPRGTGSALCVGAAPASLWKPAPYVSEGDKAPTPLEKLKPPRIAKPFRLGSGNGGEFNGPETWAVSGDYTSPEVGVKEAKDGRKPWKSTGVRPSAPLARPPRWQPEPYVEKPQPGAESRHAGNMCIPVVATRTRKPWDKVRTADAWRTRNQQSHGAQVGVGVTTIVGLDMT